MSTKVRLRKSRKTIFFRVWSRNDGALKLNKNGLNLHCNPKLSYLICLDPDAWGQEKGVSCFELPPGHQEKFETHEQPKLRRSWHPSHSFSGQSQNTRPCRRSTDVWHICFANCMHFNDTLHYTLLTHVGIYLLACVFHFVTSFEFPLLFFPVELIISSTPCIFLLNRYVLQI